MPLRKAKVRVEAGVEAKAGVRAEAEAEVEAENLDHHGRDQGDLVRGHEVDDAHALASRGRGVGGDQGQNFRHL